LLIPAGTVHAITKGIVIYEVQQNSDTTFRLYDWGRVDSEGKPRELHLAKAAQVIDFKSKQNPKITPLAINKDGVTETYLVVTRYFCLIKYNLLNNIISLKNRDKFQVLTCLRGAFLLITKGSEYSLKLGETVLIPAKCDDLKIKAVQKEAEFIVCFIPDIKEDIMVPLQAEGVALETINRLGVQIDLIR